MNEPDPVLRAAFYHDVIDFADRALHYGHITLTDHVRVLYAVAQALNQNEAFAPLPVDALALPPHTPPGVAPPGTTYTTTTTSALAPSTRPTDPADLADLARGTTHTTADGDTSSPGERCVP